MQEMCGSCLLFRRRSAARTAGGIEGGGLSRLAEFVRVDFFEFFSRGDDGDDPASGDEVKVLMGADWGGHALTA
jgi:hypothetical protein